MWLLQEALLQRDQHGGSGGTLSTVAHNMAASPGFQPPPSPQFQPSSAGFQSQHLGFSPHQQQGSPQQLQLPLVQQQAQQYPQQRHVAFDGSRLPEPPEGLPKLR